MTCNSLDSDLDSEPGSDLEEDNPVPVLSHKSFRGIKLCDSRGLTMTHQSSGGEYVRAVACYNMPAANIITDDEGDTGEEDETKASRLNIEQYLGRTTPHYRSTPWPQVRESIQRHLAKKRKNIERIKANKCRGAPYQTMQMPQNTIQPSPNGNLGRATMTNTPYMGKRLGKNKSPLNNIVRNGERLQIINAVECKKKKKTKCYSIGQLARTTDNLASINESWREHRANQSSSKGNLGRRSYCAARRKLEGIVWHLRMKGVIVDCID